MFENLGKGDEREMIVGKRKGLTEEVHNCQMAVVAAEHGQIRLAACVRRVRVFDGRPLNLRKERSHRE